MLHIWVYWAWRSVVVSGATHCTIAYCAGLLSNFGLIFQIMTLSTLVLSSPLQYSSRIQRHVSSYQVPFWAWYYHLMVSGWTTVFFSILNLAQQYCVTHVIASFKRDIPGAKRITQPYLLLFFSTNGVVAFVTSSRLCCFLQLVESISNLKLSCCLRRLIALPFQMPTAFHGFSASLRHFP
jgi:hypothetical protein